MRFILRIVFIIFLLGCTNSCSYTSQKDLLSVPGKYKNDYHKSEAYNFLLKNMPGLSYISDKGEVITDINAIKQEYLINNIDNAYESSHILLENKLIDSLSFYEYVLPYRVNASPLHNWREGVWHQHERKSLGNISTESELIDSCNAINRKLRTWFKFGVINENEDALSYSGLCYYKKGSCISMANLGIYTLRALGVPVSFDFILGWGNINGSHTWNALITRSGKTLPFLGAEGGILEYNPFQLIEFPENDSLSTFKKAGKVYRRTFSIQKKSIAYRYRDTHQLPAVLSDFRRIDITKAYFPVKDISVTAADLGQNPKLLFICNYNSGRWLPIMAAEISSGKYLFSDMAKDMLYHIYAYDDFAASTVFPPLYVNKNGQVLILKANKDELINIELKRTQSIENDQLKTIQEAWDYEKLSAIAAGKTFTRPSPEKIYTLYYWNQKWKKAATATVLDNTLEFQKVPSGGLYLISTGRVNSSARPFILYNGNVKWL